MSGHLVSTRRLWRSEEGCWDSLELELQIIANYHHVGVCVAPCMCLVPLEIRSEVRSPETGVTGRLCAVIGAGNETWVF